ncbi:hypothetical protein FPRO05_05601 [Fusarium proliferatum]|uniref:Protein kinase domain-containing protein n=1 Tax=Gibberella intermedia TaxID=948311 RepID=A0A365MMG9_GIBIN|nr:hypothetical protein FPRO05_05601 [Fusarium proliferatum]
MGSNSSTPKAQEDLKGRIRQELKLNAFQKGFLPNDKLEAYFTGTDLIDVLNTLKISKSNAQHLKTYISTRPAKRHFLLLALYYRLEWMPVIAKHEFNDNHFPLMLDNDGQVLVHRDGEYTQIPFPTKAKSKASDKNDRELIVHTQWQFLAPVFTAKRFYHDLDSNVPLPFLSESKGKKEGSYGSVTKVELHKAHQKGIVEGDGEHLNVALKKITASLDYFEREMSVLAGIQAIILENRKLHIVTPIASYKQFDTGFLIFPWTDLGNLRDFFDTKEEKEGVLRRSNRELGLERMSWLFKQMLGLCEGLVELHKDRTRDGEKRNCRHGDLKPENILLFREGNQHILRIADLGLGKFHLRSTDSRRKAKEYTKTMAGTTQYMPPEFNRDEHKHISRRHDVWSLGCIFIELIIWAAWGLEGLDKFNQMDNDEFWQVRDNSAQVIHDNVLLWMSDMEAVLSAETALGDILRLITSDMLKRLDDRSTSEKVYRKLGSIIAKANDSQAYCLDWDQKAEITGHALPAGGSVSRNRGQKAEATEMEDVWEPHTDNDFALSLSHRVESNNHGWMSKTSSPSEFKPFNDEFSQTGTPSLPVPGSDEQFLLFKEWVRICDNTHGHASNSLSAPTLNNGSLPTRVVDVGSSSNPLIRLVEREDMTSAVYLALSHRWGDDAKQHVGRTLKKNHVSRYNNIDWNELPLNFKDAITVTRGIGVQYLWIDSLCIVQDDEDDWKVESIRMEEVYSNAKCVLAASSSNSSMEGFLNRDTATPSFIELHSESGDISYISKNIDNFKVDVDESILNTRGWTLQERALARRTIHFSKNQVYFECSKGVQCESLIRYSNERASLLGDSNFPASVETRYKGGRVMLVQTLYNQYSKRTFWDSQDRPIAISGLEKRLTSAFNTLGGYGMFQLFLERSLLWKKADDTRPLSRIEFPLARNVPTWSWMAYDGVISYVEVEFDKVDWTNEYSSPFDSGSGARGKWHWEADGTNRPPVLGLKKVRHFKVGSLPRTISLDTSESRDLKGYQCVVLGKAKLDDNAGPPNPQCYVLIVKPSLETRGVFTRAGAGVLQEDQISWDCYEAGNLL